MKTIKLFPTGLILLMIVAMTAVTSPTFAYTDMLGQTWGSPMAASVSTQIWMSINRHSITGSYGTSKGKSGSSSAKTSRPAIDYGPVIEGVPSGSTSQGSSQVSAAQMNRVVQFRPTGTRLMLQEIINSSGLGEDQKPELKAELLKILSKYEADASAKGYPNDLALALVSFINLNSYVSQGRDGSPNLSTDESIVLRNSVAEKAAQTGIFDKLSDRSKQEMYELFVILGGATYQSYQDAKTSKNNEELKVTKTAAASNLKLVGIRP
jgi:hypothetical protein